MRQIRLFFLVVAVTVTPALLFGTGSFSAVGADRPVDVSVAGDSNAYLGVSTGGGEGFVGGESFTVLKLWDQFPGALSLTSVSTGSSLVDVETTTPVDIGGESNKLAVEVTCESVGDETVAFDLVAEGSDTRVSLDRRAPVSCVDPEIQRVEFRGCGNAVVEADDAIYPLDVTRIVENASDSTVTLNSDGQIQGSPGGKLLAIEADGERYENDNRCTKVGGGPPENGGGPPEEDDEPPVEPEGNERG